MGNKSRGREYKKMNHVDYLTEMGATVTGNRKSEQHYLYRPPCPFSVTMGNPPGMEGVLHGKTGH